MTITSTTESGNRLTYWNVYSTSPERLVIPRVGESIRVEKESYTVFDVEYVIPYKNVSYSPGDVYIRVKKKNDNENKNT